MRGIRTAAAVSQPAPSPKAESAAPEAAAGNPAGLCARRPTQYPEPPSAMTDSPLSRRLRPLGVASASASAVPAAVPAVTVAIQMRPDTFTILPFLIILVPDDRLTVRYPMGYVCRTGKSEEGTQT